MNRGSGNVILSVFMAVMVVAVSASAERLYLRDGWDIVNNVADVTGYAGTKDDTGLSSDYTVPSSPGGGTYAGEDELFAYYPGASSAGIIDFDFSTISELNNVGVNSAKLYMTLSTANWFKGGTFKLCEVDHAWTEDEANYWYCNTSGDIWNDWTHGMKMDDPNIAACTVPGGNVDRSGYVMEFDVTDLVRSWLEDDATQLGFAVSYVSGSLTDIAKIAGKDYATVEYRPMLEIDYDAYVCQKKTVYLRDGWDVDNNLANIGGYSGTKDDTALASSFGTYNPGPLAGAAELRLREPATTAAGIVDFDLSNLNGFIGSNVNSAMLKVTLSTAPWFKGGTFALRHCDQQWVEDVPNYWRYNAAGNTWNDWTTGMAMTGAVVDTVTVAANNTAGGRAGYVMEFDVTSLVAEWANASITQNGFALIYDNGSVDNVAYVAGKDYTTVEYRPMLEIDYRPTPPTADLTGNCYVDLLDFAVLVSQWLIMP